MYEHQYFMFIWDSSYEHQNSDVHTSTFDINDNCIPTAVKVLEKAVEIYFKKDAE